MRNAHEGPEEQLMESILIADDDCGCRDTIKMALEREGYIVESAAGVDDALCAIHRRSFDLIVCDFRMQGKTGLDLLAELHEHGLQIPVLMVSAYADAVTEETFTRLGAAGFLEKPFRRQHLIDSVVKAMH
jgi:DNA-binding NtrC family response regulator